MAEAQKQSTDVKSFDELKGKINKKKHIDKEQIITDFATRSILERDYKEDTIDVVFNTSSSTKRKLKANKPTQKQMLLIMRLSAQAAIYENNLVKIENVEKMTEIYEQFSKIAAELCVDKRLDEEFWSTKTSNGVLTAFMSELVRITQQGPMSSDELESFR